MNKVSVIIPSYNHEQFIEQAITSVLSQKGVSFELIVIDDGSKDKSPEILLELEKKYEFTLILKENEGVCATLNRGIKESLGEYIVFLASDDLMTSDRLRQQVAYLDSNSSIDVLAGAVTLIDRNGNKLKHKLPKKNGYLSFEDLLRRNYVFAPTCIFRRSVFFKYGMYNEKCVFEDYYMWLKILSQGGKILNTGEIWAFYRLDSSNYEKKFYWYKKGMTQALKEYLPHPIAVKSLARYEKIFGLKMSLYLGMGFLKKYEKDFQNLSSIYKIIVKIISLIPQRIRHNLLHCSLKWY